MQRVMSWAAARELVPIYTLQLVLELVLLLFPQESADAAKAINPTRVQCLIAICV